MQPAPFHQLADDSREPATAFWVRADDGRRLRLALWRGSDTPHGTVLLFPGRSEYVEKYADIAHDLNAAGFAALALDWRGQGLSDRLQDDPVPGHIGEFADYQRDVIEMVVAGTELDLPRPWHLLAHSMGGAIGLAALHGGLPVERAVFSAPMWGIHLGRLPLWLAGTAAQLADRIGWGGRTARRKGGHVLDESFNANLLTHDVDHWTRSVREAATWPELTIGGASFTWILQALAECRRLTALPPPDLPALIALGTEEKIVSPDAIRQLCGTWPNARLMEIEGARHELAMEVAPLRRAFVESAIDHLRADSLPVPHTGFEEP